MLLIAFIFIFSYFEYILNSSTVKTDDSLSLLISFLFSMFFGLVFYILLRVSKKPKVNRITTNIFFIVVPFIYYVQFLIYRSFKIFYDVNTVTNGAGGALTEFMGDIMRLILNFYGISRLVLFYLPTIFYFVYLKKRVDENRLTKNEFISTGVIAVIAYALALIITYVSPIHRSMYSYEYSFQNVVENMGFGTGLRLDIKNIIMGNSGGDTSFDLSYADSENDAEDIGIDKDSYYYVEFPKSRPIPTPTPEPETDVSETDEVIEEEIIEEVPVEYGYNSLDIDFEALAETQSGINKDLDLYVASLTPSKKNAYTGMFEGKNLIFISAEAFSCDVVDEERTPTLYRLINKGIQFPDFIQPAMAGTTGGEYSNIFGLLPTAGGKSMGTMTEQKIFLNMGQALNRLGYYGKAYHNNTDTIYKRNITHNKLGYSDGFMGKGSGMEEFLTTRGFPASDCEMMQGTFPTYVDKQPFNIYYMSVSGHGQYGRSINQMSYKNYDRVADLPYSDQVKCYIANNMELEDALTYLVDSLEKAGIADDTVIVMSPDHFPYGLDNDASLGNMPYLSELYGYNVETYLQRDHNRLIIWSGCIEKMEEPIIVDSPTSSLDILPTLLNLFGIEFDSRLLPGRDVFSDAEAISFDSAYDWKTDLGTYIAKRGEFIPVNDEIVIPEGYVSRIKTVVRNKYNFCKGVLNNKYYNHIYDAIYGDN